MDFYDHIQHDYAVRHRLPQSGTYDYKVIVKRGTSYPTKEPVARKFVKAAYDGQTELGLVIFEIGEDHHSRRTGQPIEFDMDPAGAVRIREAEPAAREARHRHWLNEKSPSFLKADPPAREGEETFGVEFSIDGNKHLLVTARDLRTDRLIYKDYPVVKLT